MTLGAQKLEGTERESRSSQCRLLCTCAATDCFQQLEGLGWRGRKPRVRGMVDAGRCGIGYIGQLGSGFPPDEV